MNKVTEVFQYVVKKVLMMSFDFSIQKLVDFKTQPSTVN